MKTFTRTLGILIGALAYLLAIASKPDGYHIIAATISILFVVVFIALIEVKRENDIQKIIKDGTSSADEVRAAYEEHPLVSILWMIGIIGLVIGLAWGASSVGELTPAYDYFYDREYETFKHDLELTANPEKEIPMIESRLAEKEMPQTQRDELIKLKYDLLVDWGLTIRNEGDETAAKAKWNEAVEWAEDKNIDPALAKSYLAGTQIIEVTPTPQYIAPPRELPDGSIGEVTSVYTNTDVMFLDISVQQPNGEYVGDLLPTDFIVWVNGKPVPVQNVSVTSYKNLVKPLHVDLVIDKSGSMKGQAIENAINASSALVSSLPSNALVRLVLVDSIVVTGTYVTPDEALAEIALIQARDGGGTAFWQGLLEATIDSPDKPHLVVGLTDGDDNASTIKSDGLIKVYSGSDISLIVVGIESNKFKSKVLSDFTIAVGGTYKSSNIEGLVDTFTSIARQRTSLYRVTVFVPGVDAASFKLQIGTLPTIEQMVP